MRQPENKEVRSNPAGENTAAPSMLPKNEVSMSRSAPRKGEPKPIPSTMGYAGRKIR